MASKSKIKGGAYEAKVRDILTKELKIEFKRMPLSGSIEYLKGDLWTPFDTAAWPYCIECKHYAEVNWNNLLTAKSTELYQFWKQTCREAEVMQKKPLLIYRWNRSKDFICWNDDLEIDHYVYVNAFEHKFKMGLLSDWLDQYKKLNNI